MSIYRKQLPIAIAALLCSGQLSASFVQQQQGLDERMCAVEHELAEQSKVSPVLKQEDVFYFTADYLFWHANECGLAYGVQVNNTTAEKGKVENLHFGWDSGLRLGIGYRIPHDKWEVSLNWTYFKTDASGNATTSTNLIFPEWATTITASASDLVTHMHAQWSMILNIADGEMGRYFMATKKLALRPHFGIRGLWVDQNYKTKLAGGIKLNSSAVAKDHLKISNDFSGVGLRAGLDTEWNIYERLSIYGNACYSLIYGQFELQQQEKTQLTSATALSSVNNLKDHFQQIIGVADMSLGLRWDHTFSNDWVALRLQAGWEFGAYFGINKFEHFGIGPNSVLAFIANNEDLTIQGLVLSARVDF